MLVVRAFDELTPDQQRALDEVKRDLQSEKPMDRIVCGDVGFGKTEVALRAAFVTAIDGRPVGSWDELTQIVHASAGVSREFSVRRGGSVIRGFLKMIATAMS